MASLKINGKSLNIDVEPDTPLLWAIREHVGLTGTNMAAASRNAAPAPCISTAWRRAPARPGQRRGRQADHHDRGPRREAALHKVQQAWIANDVPQCGYCQSGMIMAVAALLKEKPKPTDADIDEAITNICRCGTFQQVRAAIHTIANA